MKLGLISNPKFQEALIKLTEKEIPITLAFTLKGILKKVKEELEKYNSLKKELVEKYSKKDENGKVLNGKQEGSIQLEEATVQDFWKNILELDAMDVEMPKIDIKAFGNKLEISVIDLLLLEELLKD
jgi:hypothetical protein